MAKDRTISKSVIMAGKLLGILTAAARAFAAGPEIPHAISSHEGMLSSAVHNSLTASGMLVALVVVLVVLIIAPFYSAIMELFRPRDREAQTVDMTYTKEMRYFERSFLDKMCAVIGDDSIVGIRTVLLSKTEKIEVSGSRQIMHPQVFETLVYIHGDLETGNDVSFEKELAVTGSAKLGAENLLRAISVRGDLTIGERSAITRWAGADGDITVKDHCNLGVKVVSEKIIHLGRGCHFKSLAGSSIQVGVQLQPQAADLPRGDVHAHAWYIDRDNFSIPPGVTIEEDIIAKTSIIIGAGARVRGSISATGTVGMETGAIVEGSIFADAGILTAENCYVGGNIFSQHEVFLGSGTRVGEPGATRSVIGKDKLSLSPGVIVYGTVYAEREGAVLP
ncbi:MAG: hypothetical protein ABSH12_08995 [Endomicrobiales bacterium]|jgi:predicted acyltransferase (DUF342 family)